MTGPVSDDVFRLVVERAPEAILFSDPAGRIVFANARTEDLFGYSPEELLGEPLWLFFPERNQARYREFYEEFIAQPDRRGFDPGRQLSARHKYGTELPVEASLTVVPTYQAQLTMATFRTISDLRRRQIASMTDAARLADAQAMAHVGSFEIDTVTRERWWSDECWRLFGLEPGDGLPHGEWARATTHPADAAMVNELWARVDRGEEMPETDYRIVRPSGEVRWLRTRARVAPNGRNGNPIIIGTTMDITALRDAFDKRLEAERYFELGFDRSPIGIAVVSLLGTLDRVNPALCRIFGRPAEELLGQGAYNVLAQGEPRTRAFHDYVDGTAGDDFHAERIVFLPDRTSVWVEAMVTRVRDQDGEPAYYFLQVQDVSDRKRAEKTLIRHAFHDSLTGLPNRLMLTRRIEQALDAARRTGNQAAVLFIDVDQFKPINDTLGHDAGDLLLVLLAQRLGRVVRGSDLLGRFGGDELVVVCDRMTEELAAQLVDRISDVVREPFALAEQEVYVTVSIGVTLATGYEDVAGVLRSSDAAMYESKARQRPATPAHKKTTGMRMPDKKSPLHHLAQPELEDALRGALERREFQVVYQPLVSLESEEPIGFEALLRWQHPDLGLISPLEFIPVAEQSGLILPIGEWVLRQALEQTHRWREQLPGFASLGIGVNISAVQMQDPGFLYVVEAMLDEIGMDPAALHLELTESIVMNDIEKASGGVESLRSVGVDVVIDDFGTGYSSLAYLRDLPVNVIKIDRSFVTPLDDDEPSAVSILRAIVGLATALDITTVAEGVETARELAKLRDLGVDIGQGFLWSKPLAAEDVPGWLSGFHAGA